MRPTILLAIAVSLTVAGCVAPSGSSGSCEVVENLITIDGNSFVIVNGCGPDDSSRPATQADIERLG
ncbi:hypothetical protein [Flavimaricola marinus]|uniref:Lipoprotein n=1 Tax=Flavimaricola marinus TaxID=1819565 RepID=A0A238LDE9_9RHOB|nr:hypothetical protein [Flavimaricola marinus]SMY07445.1 hypothetical protein LOM8899_01580 [Flavimaricola marinus]